MSILPWVLLGLVAGLIACRIDRETGGSALINITLGITGAVVAGWIFRTLEMASMLGISDALRANHYNLLVAAIGSSMLLVIFHPVRRARN